MRNKKYLDKIDKETLEKELKEIRTTMVSSPYFFNKYLDSVFEPTENNTIENLYRCAMWLLYIGLELDEIVDLEINNIDLYNRRIIYKDKYYRMPDYSFDSIEKCVSTISFYYPHKNYCNCNGVWRDRFIGSKLIRGENEELKAKTIKDMLGRYIKEANVSGKTDKRMTLGMVSLSGSYYRLRAREMDCGTPPDFEALSKYQMSKTSRRVNFEGTDMFKRSLRETKNKNSNKYKLWCMAGSF